MEEYSKSLITYLESNQETIGMLTETIGKIQNEVENQQMQIDKLAEIIKILIDNK